MRKPLKTAFIAGINEGVLAQDEINEMIDISNILNLDLEWDLHDQPDVILYAGGTDINPALYGEKRLPTTGQPNLVRDGTEIYTYNKGLEWGAVHLGVCRGMQLLNVLNGGKLWQHVDLHDKSHGIQTYGPDKYQGYILYADAITSSHHQIIIPPRNGNEKHNPYFITAGAKGHKQTIEAQKSQRWLRASADRHEPPHEDIEGIWFPKTNTFGVQFHPGWNPASAKALKDLFNWWVLKESVSCVA